MGRITKLKIDNLDYVEEYKTLEIYMDGKKIVDYQNIEIRKIPDRFILNDKLLKSKHNSFTAFERKFGWNRGILTSYSTKGITHKSKHYRQLKKMGLLLDSHGEVLK